MSVNNKKTFQVDINSVLTKFAVIRPTNRVNTDAQLFYSKAFAEALSGGAMVRANLLNRLREQDLWNDALETEFNQLQSTLNGGELSLKRGAIKLSQARAIAIDMRRARLKLQQLTAIRNSLDSNTAEYFADNARFNFLISACTVYEETGQRYFKDFNDYETRENDPVREPASEALARLIYGLEDNHESAMEAKLPENQFLRRFNFVNDKLHLIDKDGHLVNSLNQRVDNEGRLINDDGQLIDVEGNVLTPDGEYAVESLPFLDDNEQPIVENVPASTDQASTEAENT